MRPIDADRLSGRRFNFVEDEYRRGWNDCVTLIMAKEPTIYVVPERKGKWGNEFSWQKCSVCGGSGKRVWPYCPHCGARMAESE